MADSLRLFLIEDDDDIALLIRKSLERAGHQVARCRTAADALIVLSQSTFDLVLLDQRLPDMAGLDLLNTLSREGIAAPALMVTAYGDEQLATRVLRAGALDYLVKDHALTFLAELPKRVVESVTRHRLEHTNSLLIQALESARDGIMITDLQGIILKVNQALVNMTGYSRSELEGQSPRLLKSHAHPPEYYAGMWRTVLGRNSWQGEVTNRRKDGTLLSTSMTISPIVDNQGRLTHFVGIQRDITEHKQLERQLLQAQKMQSVGTLAGGVAHEFNNLLAGINGYAALGLREAGLPPTVREFLQNIVSLSERAATLTRQLLAFARKPALSRRRTAIPRAGALHRGAGTAARCTSRSASTWPIGPSTADRCWSRPTPTSCSRRWSTWRSTPATPSRSARRTGRRRARTALQRRRLPRPPRAAGRGAARLPAARAPRRLRRPRSRGPGHRHGAGRVSAIGRPVLHDKRSGPRHGPGPADGVRHRAGAPGFPDHREQPRPRDAASASICRGWRMPPRPNGRAGTAASKCVEPESTPGRSILVIDDEEAVLDVVRRFLQIAGHRVTCGHQRPGGAEPADGRPRGRPGHSRPDDAARGRGHDVPAAAPAPPRRAGAAVHRPAAGRPRAGAAQSRGRGTHPQALPHERTLVRRPPGRWAATSSS